MRYAIREIEEGQKWLMVEGRAKDGRLAANVTPITQDQIEDRRMLSAIIRGQRWMLSQWIKDQE